MKIRCEKQLMKLNVERAAASRTSAGKQVQNRATTALRICAHPWELKWETLKSIAHKSAKKFDCTRLYFWWRNWHARIKFPRRCRWDGENRSGIWSLSLYPRPWTLLTISFARLCNYSSRSISLMRRAGLYTALWVQSNQCINKKTNSLRYQLFGWSSNQKYDSTYLFHCKLAIMT